LELIFRFAYEELNRRGYRTPDDEIDRKKILELLEPGFQAFFDKLVAQLKEQSAKGAEVKGDPYSAYQH